MITDLQLEEKRRRAMHCVTHHCACDCIDYRHAQQQAAFEALERDLATARQSHAAEVAVYREALGKIRDVISNVDIPVDDALWSDCTVIREVTRTALATPNPRASALLAVAEKAIEFKESIDAHEQIGDWTGSDIERDPVEYHRLSTLSRERTRHRENFDSAVDALVALGGGQ